MQRFFLKQKQRTLLSDLLLLRLLLAACLLSAGPAEAIRLPAPLCPCLSKPTRPEGVTGLFFPAASFCSRLFKTQTCKSSFSMQKAAGGTVLVVSEKTEQFQALGKCERKDEEQVTIGTSSRPCRLPPPECCLPWTQAPSGGLLGGVCVLNPRSAEMLAVGGTHLRWS